MPFLMWTRDYIAVPWIHLLCGTHAFGNPDFYRGRRLAVPIIPIVNPTPTTGGEHRPCPMAGNGRCLTPSPFLRLLWCKVARASARSRLRSVTPPSTACSRACGLMACPVRWRDPRGLPAAGFWTNSCPPVGSCRCHCIVLDSVARRHQPPRHNFFRLPPSPLSVKPPTTANLWILAWIVDAGEEASRVRLIPRTDVAHHSSDTLRRQRSIPCAAVFLLRRHASGAAVFLPHPHIEAPSEEEIE